MGKNTQTKLIIFGSQGLVGSALINEFQKDQEAFTIVPISRKDADLTNQSTTFDLIKSIQPDGIIIAAAKVGGILSNHTFPKDFIYDNLALQLNIIEGAFLAGTNKLIFLGSSCIYPKEIDRPILESDLLSGPLEPTNEPYAIAKIAGIKLCQSYNRQYGTDYRCLMPTNLYGPYDNFHPEHSHVIPALIHRFHQAKVEGAARITIWGHPSTRREFLYVSDLAQAVKFTFDLSKRDFDLATESRPPILNVGYGTDMSIAELAEKIRHVTKFKGIIEYDTSQLTGTPKKLLDSSVIHSLGWSPTINIDQGLAETYEYYKNLI